MYEENMKKAAEVLASARENLKGSFYPGGVLNEHSARRARAAIELANAYIRLADVASRTEERKRRGPGFDDCHPDSTGS